MMRCKKLQFLTAASLIDWLLTLQVKSEALRAADLGQREAAEIFGGGIIAFSRYEYCKTRPPLALVKLLKLLDRHPDLLV